MTTSIFLQYCLAGISIGSIYALIAIGYTMVYGILRLINFAHGDIFMMAAYFMIFAMVDHMIPWHISMALMIIATVVLGIVIEKGFQCGGKLLREKGLRVESLAIVDGMDAATQTVQFRD